MVLTPVTGAKNSKVITIDEEVPGALESPVAKQPTFIDRNMRRIVGGGTITIVLGVMAGAVIKSLTAATVGATAASVSSVPLASVVLVGAVAHLPLLLFGVAVSVLAWHLFSKSNTPNPEAAPRIKPLGEILENA